MDTALSGEVTESTVAVAQGKTSERLYEQNNSQRTRTGDLARPHVSVVLSAKNEERHLHGALESIAQQSFTDWECLIFDDGSTDATRAIAEGFARHDDRFRVFFSDASEGLAQRLNYLIGHARGELIARMDADDLMLPTRLQRQVDYFDALPKSERESTVLGGSVLLMSPEGHELGERTAPQRTKLSIRQFPPLLHPTVMASKSWYESNPYDMTEAFRRAEDSELWVRTHRSTNFRNLADPLLRYRTIGTFEPERFVRSQRAMVRIGARHRVPLLVLRGILGMLAGFVAVHSKPALRFAMKLRRHLVGERLTALIRRTSIAAVQWSGRLAVLASSTIAFDFGAALHRHFRGLFIVKPSAVIFFCALTVLMAFLVGLPEGPASKRQAFAAALAASVATSLITLLSMALFAPSLMPRFFLLIVPAIETPLLFISWLYARGDDAREQQRSRVFVVASSLEAQRLHEQIGMYPERPASLVGTLLIDEWGGQDVAIADLVRNAQATVVVLSVGAQNNEQLMADVAQLHKMGIRVRSLISFYEQWLGKLPLYEVSNMALMVDHSDTHRLMLGRIKRMLDLATAFVGAVLFICVLPFILIGNALGNRGPLFFVQTRVGRNGKMFQLRKLRTMYVPAAQDSGFTPAGPIGKGEWTQPDDPRVTKFGSLLRRCHIDELPQFFNILSGDLSLVGPRPEQPHYVEELSVAFPFYELRHGVRPGLTGWAQVKWPYGSSMDDAEHKLQYDLFYVVHQGLAMDLKTIGRTFRAVLLRGGR